MSQMEEQNKTAEKEQQLKNDPTLTENPSKINSFHLIRKKGRSKAEG